MNCVILNAAQRSDESNGFLASARNDIEKPLNVSLVALHL